MQSRGRLAGGKLVFRSVKDVTIDMLRPLGYVGARGLAWLRRRIAPKSLGEVNLKGTFQGYGMKLADEGKFFGWNPSSVSKSASDFTKEQLLARGWTKERLLEVAEKYEWINKLTAGHRNPSAAGRAAQLREIVEKLF